ncbi:MAG TPA: LytTR family DNA-binding domain-containing protein [Burkholderiaceae bacterium]
MRTILVDDEELARALVREYLSAHDDIEIVAECANGFEAVKAIAELQPDLILLDIQMPKLNGFEVLELAATQARVIFLTAYDQYAVQAFEVHACDYLLKPYTQQRFDAALQKARTAAGPVPPALIEDGTARDRPDGKLDRILIRIGLHVHVVASAQIDYIEAQDDYVQIHAAGKSYLKAQRLAELESQLDPHAFLRIHRSWLVNVERIARIEQATKDSHVAVLADGTRLPVSRSGYQKVKSLTR